MTNKILKILLKPRAKRNIGELLNMMKFYQNCTNGEFRLAYALDHINMTQDKEVENRLLSNCCSAKVSLDNDICPDCGEHCGAVDANDKDYAFEINRWVLDK